MKRTLFYSIAITVAILVVVTLSVVTWYQQTAIDSLLIEAKVGQAYYTATEYYVQALRDVLERHIEEGCITQKEEAKIIKRIDLAVRQVNQMTREFQ